MMDNLKVYKTYYKSEIGLLEIMGTTEVVKSIYFIEPEAKSEIEDDNELPQTLVDCMIQLDEYFKCKRQEFSLKLKAEGTKFQEQVWQQLLTIPFGKTASYLDIAKGINNEKAVRAVGAANGQNPISIIIPCHRVIGSNGNLTGYGGGLWRKEWLLKHEGCFPGEQLALF